jgi:hypothetical protein
VDAEIARCAQPWLASMNVAGLTNLASSQGRARNAATFKAMRRLLKSESAQLMKVK